MKIKFSVILALVFVGAVSGRLFGEEKMPPKNYQITTVEGPTGIIPHASEKASPAVKGLVLLPGDRIVTGKKGRVEFASGEGSVLEVGQKSSLKVDQISPIRHSFFLKVGRLLGHFASARKYGTSYQLRTPVVVGSIRGTEVALEVWGDEEVQAGVIEGEVTFEKLPGPIDHGEVGVENGAQSKPPEGKSSREENTPAEESTETEEEPLERKETIVVKASEGIVVQPGKEPLKINKIPPLVIGSLDWFENVRVRIPALRETLAKFDRPALLKLREKALSEEIQWHVPPNFLDELASPRDQIGPPVSPEKSTPKKIKIPSPR